jgi:hypothetical protein
VGLQLLGLDTPTLGAMLAIGAPRSKSFSSSDLLTRAAPDNSDAILLAGAGSVSICTFVPRVLVALTCLQGLLLTIAMPFCWQAQAASVFVRSYQ